MKNEFSKAYKKQSENAKESVKNNSRFSRPENRNTNLHNSKFNSNATYYEEVYNTKWKDLKNDEYKKYREMWQEIPEKKITTNFPLHLDIETTNVCNLLCPMCPRTIHLANESFSELGYISKEDYKYIIDQATANNCKSIKLNYLGEPLAHKELIWQVKYAKEKGIIDVMFNTNASLLTKEKSKDLLEAGIDNVFVSFDAVDPQEFSIQRKGTTIGRVIDNVFNFILLKNEIRPSCQLRLSMVMYKDEKWQKQFEALKIMWSDHVDALGWGYFVDRDIENSLYFPEVKGFHCAQPFQRMFLKYNGNVTICCVDDKDEVIVGNWREQNLKDIWLGEKYSEIRKLHSSGNYYKMEMCKKCYMPHG
ncbi:radical SAM/SPASM domain-containing protein [Candidatus Pelagibacter sp. HIMB1748]|uniref:radical SAM/SPASM domain-containing protein n=1 Tax=unclassified Candidatus Pelagibacter TaxID=2647897 RepID=UPI003F87C9E6